MLTDKEVLNHRIENDPIYWTHRSERPQYCYRCGFFCIPLHLNRKLCKKCLDNDYKAACEESDLATSIRDHIGHKRRELGFPRLWDAKTNTNK